MIQIIGLMIGSYIALRCLSLVTRTGDRAEDSAVQIFAVIVMVVSIIGVIALFALPD